jgi:hypothetical protein
MKRCRLSQLARLSKFKQTTDPEWQRERDNSEYTLFTPSFPEVTQGPVSRFCGAPRSNTIFGFFLIMAKIAEYVNY